MGLAGLWACLAWTGCSSFNREWKTRAAGPPPTGMEGRWEGTWQSDKTGHTGPLRCLITPQTDDLYQAWFHAKYKKVFTWSFAYKVDLHVEPRDGTFQFHGQEDLGKLAGGVYHYEGKASSTNFFSTYRCPKDDGTFQMKRPQPRN